MGFVTDVLCLPCHLLLTLFDCLIVVLCCPCRVCCGCPTTSSEAVETVGTV
jgi:hypothetical protein